MKLTNNKYFMLNSIRLLYVIVALDNTHVHIDNHIRNISYSTGKMSAGIQLDKLLNIALGTPEVGAVNFNALHGVLSEIIKTLGVGSKLVEVRSFGDPDGSYQSYAGTTSFPAAGKTYNEKIPSIKGLDLETKVTNLEKKLKVLDEIPNNAEIVQRIRGKDTKTSVGDIWQFININRRLSATEDAIEKVGMYDSNRPKK